ncbi:MAG: MFS transporter [Ignavibacteria bacterium]|nr:MFS transporter [Ignavibacteria bacterium]
MTKLSPKRTNKLNSKFLIFNWTLFDFGNTSFSIVVVTFLYAVYFKKIIVSGLPEGDLYWSWAISISMLITSVIAPVLGAIADYSAGKKRFLLFFTIICIVATANLFFLKEGDVFWGILLFIIANIGFEAGLVFYDSFLPDITTEKNFGRVSGYGYGMGYLGSLVTLTIAYPFIQNDMIKETFPLAAVFFLIFSIPLFLFIRDDRKEKKSSVNYLRIGFLRVWETVSNLKKFKNLALFLLAYFFYIEGVNTVIFFSGNYASSTLSFSFTELILFFIIVQSTAIIGSVIFGIVADSFGYKKTIITSLIIWIFTILFAFITSDASNWIVLQTSEYFTLSTLETEKKYFYFVGLLAGSVMGATQSVSRSLMSVLVPINKKTEFFGFFSMFGKSSAIVGPLVFGLISYIFESQRLAILSIAVFFVVGLLILLKVEEKQ